MFKKTKEKINNNNYIKIFKELWANKRYRALIVLVLYFIFFFIIITGLRASYQASENNDDKIYFSLETLTEKYNNLKNYNYTVSVNEVLTIEGELKEGVNSFKYNEESYTFINNNLYKEKDENLEKIDLEETDELIKIINKIKLGEFINHVSTLDRSGVIDDNAYKLDFELPNSYFDIEEEGNIKASIAGEPNNELDEIIIDLTAHKREEYIVSITVNEENV